MLDRTPFYAESGGQVGDTGTITTAPGAIIDIVDTQYGLPGQITLHRGRVRVGTVVEGDEVERRDRRRAPRPHPPQSHRHPRAALGAARGARHARAAGRFVRRSRSPALRLLAPRAGHRRAARAGRAPRQRAGDLRRAGAPLRDDEGRSRAHRRDRVLRREVRRHRARARGRSVDRAVRRHPRARARVHRSDQGRERGLDRLEPAPHRGDDRRRRVRVHRVRRAAAAPGRRPAARDAQGGARPDRAPRRAGARARGRAARAAGEGSRRTRPATSPARPRAACSSRASTASAPAS